jgi:uncharacterized protein (DUF1800 family)
MLVYLDSEENRKTHPNENYARELLELFCLGPGNYTEQDIKELARCFTGWEVRKQHFKFNPYQHDTSPKVVLGETAEMDGDQAIEVILRQPAAAVFIAKKLIRFFVTDETPIPDALAQPIADELRESEFDTTQVVKKILSSRYFYSTAALGGKIKSPVELAIGLLRFLEGTTNVSELTRDLRRLGQLPLYPPNVKGWDGGKVWINASTILARANLSARLVAGNQTKFSHGEFDGWLKHCTRLTGDKTLGWLNEYLFAVPVDRDRMKPFEQQMQSNPAQALAALTALPEFQIN